MRLDHIYLAHNIFKTHRYPVKMQTLREKFAQADADKLPLRTTVQRVLNDLRDTYHAPLEYDKKGWYYTKKDYELPGLWFNSVQLRGLLVMEQALEQLQAGFLADYLAPFRTRIQTLLTANGEQDNLTGRIRWLSTASRIDQYQRLPVVANALLRRQQLKMVYHSRGKDEVHPRTVSPQRLILYRDNWYLDGYCHKNEGIRSFALDAIEQLEVLDQPAMDYSLEAIEQQLMQTYGIFTTSIADWAVLHFDAHQTRWVKNEQWHPQQLTKLLADGSLELHIPFGNMIELAREILKYGAAVEVISPANLRQHIVAELTKALARYPENLSNG